MEKKLSRRTFLCTFSIGTTAVLLAACQPKIVEVTKIVEREKIVKETVEVEKIVKEAVEVEKEVTRVVEKEVVKPAPKLQGDRPGRDWLCREISRGKVGIAPPGRPWQKVHGCLGRGQRLPRPLLGRGD